ncbi:hypothetical protein M430DRAFT_58556 [Amorphotheca resinae ATCC 22711]|uniref:DUF7730 domain-containing protein n=1 Tax=Amorphotheca resinae ATCC 22711 TaxID=857342 RepID=A0A2T3B1E2_AMORE|nr:hypothetical protein M430DRAFT_58556 [Amorphotheca resinae ATCC 22711]PSS18375.1 hypothetical protein M430DRAFT_58556 [Amorphotheca resinae ATCC 22711]
MTVLLSGKDLKKAPKWRPTNVPSLLPRKRPRALTCPLPAKTDKSWNPFKKSVLQQTCDQSQSGLARLPGEIRQLIWTEVLGRHLLHIVYAPQRLLAIDCAEEVDDELETRHHLCWGVTTAKAPSGSYLYPHSDHPAKPANLLPLLQTCRRIYTEVISILYEDNIFDIGSLLPLLYLQRSVLPQRLNQIRVLNLTYSYAMVISASPLIYEINEWREACDVLMSFAGLQELTVHFKKSRKDSWPGADGKSQWGPLLEALTQINTAKKKFDVFLPWTEDECAEAAKEGGYPFRLMPMADVEV